MGAKKGYSMKSNALIFLIDNFFTILFFIVAFSAVLYFFRDFLIINDRKILTKDNNQEKKYAYLNKIDIKVSNMNTMVAIIFLLIVLSIKILVS
jgi:hypothetical protein